LLIDLNDPKGNAFSLIGITKNLARQTGQDAEKIHKEMLEGDYDHLVNTMLKYVGDYVEII